jgi:hypothetical protein
MSTFPKNILSASSGLGSGDLYSLEDGRLRPEHGDRMYLRNVGIDLLNCMAPKSKTTPSDRPPGKLQISHVSRYDDGCLL